MDAGYPADAQLINETLDALGLPPTGQVATEDAIRRVGRQENRGDLVNTIQLSSLESLASR